jgi:predicted acetyltransferase
MGRVYAGGTVAESRYGVTPMGFEIRALAPDELDAYRDAMMTTFGEDANDVDPEGAIRTRHLMNPAQLWAAFDGPAIVATAGTHMMALVVPGGATLPMAGLTMVTVRPTHRRRGLSRALIEHHLGDARTRGLPISGLWASESSIYGRFGYALATESHALSIANAHALELAEPERSLDTVDWIETARAREVLPAIYARATALRPGALVRSAVWWEWRRFLESPFARAGKSRLRHVVAQRAGEPVGYLQYRQHPEFDDDMLPAGVVSINELVGVDARAEASLWAFALRVDLCPKVTWWNAPLDDVLPWIVADRRRVIRRRTDALWLRIEDVAGALAARTYAADGALSFAVDDREPIGLVIEGGRARVAPAAHAALRLSRASLGALYLGTTSASLLARAGRLDGDPAAITFADRAFASSIAPWCPEVF